MYCLALRTAARYSGWRKFEVTFRGPRFFDFANGGVVFRAEAAVTFGENIANDPQLVLHVIESDEAVIEHQHRVVEADFIAEALGDALDQPHHVVAEIADGAGDQRRQTGKTDGTKTLDALAQEGDGVALLPNHTVAAFEDTRAVGVAEDFLGMRACEGVAGDFFAAFHTFEKEGVPRTLGNAQIGADGSQQVRRKDVVDADQVALFCQALKFSKVRLDHGSEFTVDSFQFTDKGDLLLHHLRPARLIRQRPRVFWKYQEEKRRQAAALQSSKRDPSLPIVVQDRHPWSGVWLTITGPTPLFFVSVASKGLSVRVSGLESTLTGLP